MRRNSILVNALHRLFAGLRVILSMLFLVNICIEIFSDDGKLGTFFTANHYSKGYNIPIKIKTNVPNAVFDNLVTLNEEGHTNNNGQKWRSTYMDYVNGHMEIIDKGTKNIISFNFFDNVEYFTTNQSTFNYNGYITAKSDKLYINALQIVKIYIPFLGLILIFFFLERIFYNLKKSLIFSDTLYSNVKKLGYVFIIVEIINLVASYLLSKYYSLIRSETLIDGKTLSDSIQLTITPRLEFDFSFFVIGFSLLVLAVLLKSGNEIQQENDLTI